MKFPKVKKKLKKKDCERNCYNCKLRFIYYGKERRCPYPYKIFHIENCDRFEFFSTLKSI